MGVTCGWLGVEDETLLATAFLADSTALLSPCMYAAGLV